MSLMAVWAVSLFFLNSVDGHPQCLDFKAPFIPDRAPYFCSRYSEYSCCTAERERQLYRRFAAIYRNHDYRTFLQCQDYAKKILCAECDPYAAHIFDAETRPESPLSFPGLCNNYCQEFYNSCSEIIKTLTNDTQLSFSNRVDQFCSRLQLTDKDYCYPELQNNPSLTGTLERNKDARPGCMCVEKVVDGLSNPVFFTFAKDENKIFVLEQSGIIWIYQHPQWKRKPNPFLDIRGRVDVSPRLADERGLLGLAFHPNFQYNRRFYVYYTGLTGSTTEVRISEFHVRYWNREEGDPGSEKILIQLPKPNNWWNHNGGMVMFGTDGMLYAFIGDGGGAGDRSNLAQNRSNLWGTAIRLDVSQRASDRRKYQIPWNNPFKDNSESLPEVYAYGLRNAWRCAVDRGDAASGEGRGRIFCGDVGQDAFEEIDLIQSGGNYGWRPKEGFACYKRNECSRLAGDVLPIFAYPHRVGKSVIGGYVYRGCENPALRGFYIYGDYLNGRNAYDDSGRRLFRLKQNDGFWENNEIFMCTDDLCTNFHSNTYEQNILSFAEDFRGEIYMLATKRPTISNSLGAIYRLLDPRVRSDPSSCNPSPPV